MELYVMYIHTINAVACSLSATAWSKYWVLSPLTAPNKRIHHKLYVTPWQNACVCNIFNLCFSETIFVMCYSDKFHYQLDHFPCLPSFLRGNMHENLIRCQFPNIHCISDSYIKVFLNESLKGQWGLCERAMSSFLYYNFNISCVPIHIHNIHTEISTNLIS